MPKRSKITKDKIIELRNNGYKNKDIAKYFNVSIDVLSYHIQKHKLQKFKKRNKEELIGQKFGKLTIINITTDRRRTSVECLCDCGNKKTARLHSIIRGTTRSCGCLYKPDSEIHDISGQVYGYLTVVGWTGKMQNRTSLWNCLCSCGREKIVTKASLTNGTKSCGRCLVGNKNKLWKGCGDISGQYWCGIKKSADRRNIALNITIQEAWDLYIKQNGVCSLSGRKIILQKELRGKYNYQTASLDRIDSTKPYVLDNCQWVHVDCNFSKQDFENEEYIRLCRDVGYFCGYKLDSLEVLPEYII